MEYLFYSYKNISRGKDISFFKSPLKIFIIATHTNKNASELYKILKQCLIVESLTIFLISDNYNSLFDAIRTLKTDEYNLVIIFSEDIHNIDTELTIFEASRLSIPIITIRGIRNSSAIDLMAHKSFNNIGQFFEYLLNEIDTAISLITKIKNQLYLGFLTYILNGLKEVSLLSMLLNLYLKDHYRGEHRNA